MGLQCSFVHLCDKYLLSHYHVPRTWNQYLCSCFLTAGDGQTLLAECQAYEKHFLNISIVIVIIKVAPQYGDAQTNNVSFGHRITKFQEEHMGTTFHLFQIICFKENPSIRKIDSPPLLSQCTNFRGSRVTFGGSLGPSPQQEVQQGSRWTVSSKPPDYCSAVQGPSVIHCR